MQQSEEEIGQMISHFHKLGMSILNTIDIKSDQSEGDSHACAVALLKDICTGNKHFAESSHLLIDIFMEQGSLTSSMDSIGLH